MDRLKNLEFLAIREKKEYRGFPENWKFKPEFCIADRADEEVFYAVSEKGSTLGFGFLKEAKEYTLYVVDQKGKEVLYFEKHFGPFANKATVFNAEEDVLGIVRRNTQSAKTVYEVFDPLNQLLYQIEGPAAAPETLHIKQNEMAVGKISRRLAKAVEDGVSKQVHFGIVFPMGCGPAEKGVLLGSLFLIDFSH